MKSQHQPPPFRLPFQTATVTWPPSEETRLGHVILRKAKVKEDMSTPPPQFRSPRIEKYDSRRDDILRHHRRPPPKLPVPLRVFVNDDHRRRRCPPFDHRPLDPIASFLPPRLRLATRPITRPKSRTEKRTLLTEESRTPERHQEGTEEDHYNPHPEARRRD